ncbi:LuxR C-terminal-related transcriptional regulator [Labrys sp. La1]|uniref:helix-turn-helix transcriptional regulator n=1 Tax=Labrys sp. La1 TaxID=3404917 RepID=UPI003EB9D445
MPPPFQAWNRLLAHAVEAIGSPGFPAALQTVLRLIAPFEMINGFRYTPDGRAHDLHNPSDLVDRGIIVDQYLAGAYVLDPFYDAVRGSDATSLIVMQDLAPDHFRQSEYYRIHYAATTIRDEIGFVLDLGGRHVGVLSISRLGTNPLFRRRQIEQFGDIAGLICRLAERHWQTTRPPSLSSEALPSAAIAHPQLTPREREIVALILKGHSSLSVGALLSLSPETVKVHRRHIYAKLKISSQGQLFRLFLAGQSTAA